jgi:uncharacterized protein involved in type VI secretion and phage assembly
MSTNDGGFYGKYRGLVSNTRDPENRGRIQAKVPGIYGDTLSPWALPCLPFGGGDLGLFVLPPEGSNVWIEFEGGNLEYPIWSGCFWQSNGDMPQELQPAPEQKVLLKTPGGHMLLLDDSPGMGGVTLQASGGQKIVINDQEIEISNGEGSTIRLLGMQVMVNNKELGAS